MDNITQLYTIENKLRDIVTELQTGTLSDRDVEYLCKVSTQTNDKISDILYVEDRDLYDGYTEAKDILQKLCLQLPFNKIPENKINNFCDYIEDTFSVKCRYNASESIASQLNDFTSCYHRLIEMIEKKVGKRVPNTKKCYMSGEPDEFLLDLCRFWDKYTELADLDRKYDKHDYNSLVAHIDNESGSFRVGSSANHAVHIDLYEGEKLQYYDDDKDVNYIMNRLLEDAGLLCDIHDYGVECEIDKDNIDIELLALALSAATSMDLRVSENPSSYYRGQELGEFIIDKNIRNGLEEWFWKPSVFEYFCE